MTGLSPAIRRRAEGIAADLVGKGTNVSFIVVARFPAERPRAGNSTGTLKATRLVSFAAAIAYLSFAATDFR